MHRVAYPTAAKVAETLIARGHPGVIVTRDEPTATAQEAAAALGVDIGAIVKSVIFLLDDNPVMLLVSGKHRVDLGNTGERLGGTLTAAPREMVEHATGQPIGGIAPVGHPTNLPTYVDSALGAYSVLWAAGGHPNTVFRTTYRELLRITAGLAVEVD